MAINLTTTQAQARFRTLPDGIKEALFSEHSAEIVGKTAEAHNIPPSAVPEAATLAGYVFLGFLHDSEIGRELAERTIVPRQTADEFAKELSQKLFSSYRAELETIYAPAISEEENEEVVAPAASPVAPTEMKAPATAEEPLPIEIVSTPEGRREGMEPATTALVEKKSENKKVQMESRIEPPAPRSITETPALIPTPAEPPKPLMVQKEEELKPVGRSGFKLDIGEIFKKPFSIGGNAKSSRTGPPAPPKAARLEIGEEATERPGGSQRTMRTQEPTPRVVHYTDFRTPLTPFTGESEGKKPAAQQFVPPSPPLAKRGEVRWTSGTVQPRPPQAEPPKPPSGTGTVDLSKF